jgi:lycopene cyclase-like protein
MTEAVKAGVHFCKDGVSSIEEGIGNNNSMVCLSGDIKVAVKVPVVAAGHYSKLVKYHSPGAKVINNKGEYMTENWKELVDEKKGSNPWGWKYAQGGAPGYQIAYGIEAETDGPHGYPVDEMVLMDWSGEHLEGDIDEAECNKVPTFLYVMPTDETHIFLEETSLVGRPSVTIGECERRLEVRLKHRGIKIKKIHEVERCVIPMGGPLPILGERTVAYGASNNLVHPATGYMVNRAIGNAESLAAAIQASLDNGLSLNDVSQKAWNAVWPQEALRIRDFQVFGMEVLLNMNLDQSRAFFKSFFSDPEAKEWRQYLAMDLSSRECLEFALGLFVNCSPAVKLRFMYDGVTRDGVTVVRSLLGL